MENQVIQKLINRTDEDFLYQCAEICWKRERQLQLLLLAYHFARLLVALLLLAIFIFFVIAVFPIIFEFAKATVFHFFQ